jgi:tetratricopeptide (TPR) repeat protein
MKRLATLFFLTIFISLLADEQGCLCGTITKDPLYARAVFLLNLSIRQTPLSGSGSDFPEVASEFYPPPDMRLVSDDPYPFEGHISWGAVNKCIWDRDVILKNEDEDGHHLSLPTHIEIPIKILRTIEWTDHPNGPVEYEHQEKKAFNFRKNYGVIPQAFRILKNDIATYYEKSEFFLNARMQDLSNNVLVYEWAGLMEREVKRQTLLERRKKARLACRKLLNFIEKKETEAFIACTQSLDWCIANHHSPLAHMNRGLFYYLEGNTLDALEQVKATLEKLKCDGFKKLREDAIFLKGQTELEAGLYADAVLTLTELINKNPTNKKPYLERASAYFELGDFDLSLEDYLASEEKPQATVINSIEMVSFSLGLTKGILQGGAQASIEFIPSLLSSLHGIGHGLWVFA